MATKSKEVAQAQAETECKSEKKFTIAKMQEHSYTLFGVPASTFAGATAGLTGTYTVSEVKEIINDWYKKEAK